jgi:hypothetical protein
MHAHRAIKSKSKIRGWTICVTPRECAANPRRQWAHGSYTQVDVCSCGAERLTEANQTARNRSPWSEVSE